MRARTHIGVWEAIALGVPTKIVLFWMEELYKEFSGSVAYLRDLASEIGETVFRQYVRDCLTWQGDEPKLKALPFGSGREKYIPAVLRVMRRHPNAEVVVEAKKAFKGIRKTLKEIEKGLEP